jgi:hypothetical protein
MVIFAPTIMDVCSCIFIMGAEAHLGIFISIVLVSLAISNLLRIYF